MRECPKEGAIRILVSIKTTALIAALIVLYQTWGKLFGGALFPYTMVFFGSVLIAQSLAAGLFKAWRLRGGRYYDSRSLHAAGHLGEADAPKAWQAFEGEGYLRQEAGDVVVYQSKAKTALIAELAIHGLVILICASGIYFYESSLSGAVELKAAGNVAHINKKTNPLHGGFLANDKYDFKLATKELIPGGGGRLPRITFEYIDSDQVRNFELEQGVSANAGKFSITFTGDPYFIFLFANEGKLEYSLTVPGGMTYDMATGLYRGITSFEYSGKPGTVTYDAQAGLFHVKIVNGESAVFDGDIKAESSSTLNGITVVIGPMAHIIRFHIFSRSNAWLLKPLAVLLLALIVWRLAMSPSVAVFRKAGGGYESSASGEARRIIGKLSG